MLVLVALPNEAVNGFQFPARSRSIREVLVLVLAEKARHDADRGRLTFRGRRTAGRKDHEEEEG
jgi:hypothetical protein